jgi:hypothetical protein
MPGCGPGMMNCRKVEMEPLIDPYTSETHYLHITFKPFLGLRFQTPNQNVQVLSTSTINSSIR